MDKYYQLNKIFHMGFNVEKEYEKRISDYNTYRTALKIVPIKNGVFSKEQVYPLFLINFKQLNKLSNDIVKNSYHIEKEAKSLPVEVELSFLKTLLLNELQSTNEIENVISTKKELSQILEEIEQGKTVRKHKNFLGLVSLYFDLLRKSNSINLDKVEDIRAVYDELVSFEVDEKNKLDGSLFRKEEVGVYSESKGKFLHKGVIPETNIILKLSDMLNFLNNNDDMPYLYKIMVAHYFFEYIHPFYDGNGRVGRYILVGLVAEHLDIYTAITFSYMVNRNRNKYYKSFESTSDPLNKGEISFFVYDMLSFIKEGQEEVKCYLISIISKFNKIDKFLKENADDELTYKVLRLVAVNTLFSSDVRLSIKNMMDLLSISRSTLNKRLKKYENSIVYISKKPRVVIFKESFIDSILLEQ